MFKRIFVKMVVGVLFLRSSGLVIKERPKGPEGVPGLNGRILAPAQPLCLWPALGLWLQKADP